jgi:hypothetical protein
MKLQLLLGLAIASVVGCTHGSGATNARAPTTHTATTTAERELVAIDSGVWVVRDAEQPIYYVDNFYYTYRDNEWYRSPTYTGGWVNIDIHTVPNTIVARDHDQYRHYRGDQNAMVRTAPRSNIAVPAPSSPYEPPPPTAIGGGPRVVPPIAPEVSPPPQK